MSQGHEVPTELEKYANLLKEVDERQRKQGFVELMRNQEQARQQRVIESNRQRTAQQVTEWRKQLEELAQLETILSAAIASEKGLIGTEGMGWPARLDQMLGELGRYRETLMRRIADKALERLAPPITSDGQASVGGV